MPRRAFRYTAMTDCLSLEIFVRRASLAILVAWLIHVSYAREWDLEVRMDLVGEFGSTYVPYVPGPVSCSGWKAACSLSFCQSIGSRCGTPPLFLWQGREVTKQDLNQLVLDGLAKRPQQLTQHFCDAVARDLADERLDWADD